MRPRGWTWWLGLLLGILLSCGYRRDIPRGGDGGHVFWFGTLVGGGALILVGTYLLPQRPIAGGVLTGLGCLAGLPPTMWTVVVPLLHITLAVAAASRTARAAKAPPNRSGATSLGRHALQGSLKVNA